MHELVGDLLKDLRAGRDQVSKAELLIFLQVSVSHLSKLRKYL